MMLIDLTHTSHTPANTGIQRLARSLYAAIAARSAVTPVCYDPYGDSWRPLDEKELACASGDIPVGLHRGSRWSVGQKLRGWSSRLSRRAPRLPAANGFICPELFSPAVAARLPALLAQIDGPRIAFFFDAIPLTHPEFTPPKTVARFPAFMQELLQFDGIAAISQTSAAFLSGYWRWLGVANPPPISVVPLGVDRPVQSPPGNASSSRLPQVLCVSSIEGRKNHGALLEAAENLWEAGLVFELRLVGLPRPETAASALAHIRRLQAANRPLRFDGVLDEPALDAAWRDCAFSVYPSAIEGFGLPVIESLAHGKPCICAGVGATGELVAGGGCIGVNPADGPNFVAAIRHLLTEPQTLARLKVEAAARPVPSWAQCADHVLEWMSQLAGTPRRQFPAQ